MPSLMLESQSLSMPEPVAEELMIALAEDGPAYALSSFCRSKVLPVDFDLSLDRRTGRSQIAAYVGGHLMLTLEFNPRKGFRMRSADGPRKGGEWIVRDRELFKSVRRVLRKTLIDSVLAGRRPLGVTSAVLARDEVMVSFKQEVSLPSGAWDLSRDLWPPIAGPTNRTTVNVTMTVNQPGNISIYMPAPADASRSTLLIMLQDCWKAANVLQRALVQAPTERAIDGFNQLMNQRGQISRTRWQTRRLRGLTGVTPVLVIDDRTHGFLHRELATYALDLRFRSTTAPQIAVTSNSRLNFEVL